MKLFFSIFLVILHLGTQAQLSRIPGLGDKPKNDLEAMNKSKASKPLNRIHSNSGQRNKDDYRNYQTKNNPVEYGDINHFKEEERYLRNWESSVKSDREDLEEVKTLDPKFKWDKLKTDYRKNIEIAAEGVVEARTNFNLRLAFYNYFKQRGKDVSVALGNSKPKCGYKYAYIFWNKKPFLLSTFMDSVQLAKKQDPEMKNIPYLKEMNDLCENTAAPFIASGIQELITGHIACAKETLASYAADKHKNANAADDILNNLESFLKDIDVMVPNNAHIKAAPATIENARSQIKEDLAKIEKEREEARLKKVDAMRMPKATMSDPEILAAARECIKQNMHEGATLLKTVIEGTWLNNRHKYTNQILSREIWVAAAIKEADGKCFIYHLYVRQSRNDNNTYSKSYCDGFMTVLVSTAMTSTSDYLREEINPENVK